MWEHADSNSLNAELFHHKARGRQKGKAFHLPRETKTGLCVPPKNYIPMLDLVIWQNQNTKKTSVSFQSQWFLHIWTGVGLLLSIGISWAVLADLYSELSPTRAMTVAWVAWSASTLFNVFVFPTVFVWICICLSTVLIWAMSGSWFLGGQYSGGWGTRQTFLLHVQCTQILNYYGNAC